MSVMTYNVSIREHPEILESLKAYLYSQNFTVNEFKKGNGVILQIRRGGKFKTVIGLSVGLTITIDDFQNYFTVSYTDARWIDKILVGIVSLLILWPLIITVAVGTYKQAELPKNLTSFLHREVHGCIQREATWQKGM